MWWNNNRKLVIKHLNRYRMKLVSRFIILSFTLVGCYCHIAAQTGQTAETSGIQLTIPALFEYPSVPEDIDGLSAKCNWLVEHFWDNFDIRKQKTVDQSALNHAFSVYVAPMQWADSMKSLGSVEKLLSSLQKNPALLLQFTKAAEENIYGPRATMYIDEIYIRFLEAVVKNKKLKPTYKSRYEYQLKQLSGSQVGSTAPGFKFKKPDGTTGRYFPTGNYTIIEFGDPECFDCTMSKLKLDTDVSISELIKTGKVNICFIIPDGEEGWEKTVKDYPSKWVVGSSDEVSELYDLRQTPAFYIVGPDKKIKAKNITVDEVIEKIKELTATN